MAQGETLIGITFMHDIVTLPSRAVRSRSWRRARARATRSARRASSRGAEPRERQEVVRLGAHPEAQALGAQAKSVPGAVNKNAPVPQAPKFTQIKLINYDFAKYGSSAERKRLLRSGTRRSRRSRSERETGDPTRGSAGGEWGTPAHSPAGSWSSMTPRRRAGWASPGWPSPSCPGTPPRRWLAGPRAGSALPGCRHGARSPTGAPPRPAWLLPAAVPLLLPLLAWRRPKEDPRVATLLWRRGRAGSRGLLSRGWPSTTAAGRRPGSRASSAGRDPARPASGPAPCSWPGVSHAPLSRPRGTGFHEGRRLPREHDRPGRGARGVFVFWPVATVLASAVRDESGALAPAVFSRSSRPAPSGAWTACAARSGAASPGTRCSSRSWWGPARQPGLAFALIATRTGFPAKPSCARCPCSRSSRRRS